MAFVSAPTTRAPNALTTPRFSFLARLKAWNDVRVTRNALSRLSDHELRDIGLTRADIDTFGAHTTR